MEGTLVQTIEANEEAIREFRASTRKRLLELGIPQGELGGIVAATLMRNQALEYVKEHFDKDEAERFYREMDKFFMNYELSWADDSKLYPDTHPALRELRQLGVRMAVVTNTSRAAADRELTMHGLKDYFEVVITREDVEMMKPDPAGTLLALKKLNAHNFFFVGDLVHDSMAAEKAGGTSIIVNRNLSNKPKFHANYIVKSLTEIPRILSARYS